MKVLLSYATNKQQRNNTDLMRVIMGTAGLSLRSANFFNTKTIETDEPIRPDNLDIQLTTLKDILDRAVAKHFIYFRIPKASGGTRNIEAPECEYKQQLQDITELITKGLRVLPHDSAYAYTRGRSAKDALILHQEQKARWFLKIDLKDFFPSITEDLLLQVLPTIFPFNYFNQELLASLCNVAVNKDGVLPQGSPLSPLLSNIIMVKFDKVLSSKLTWFKRNKYTYTRYADDLLISCPYKFKYSDVVECIRDTLLECELPFRINGRKTRYQSFSGSNWNLGLMYNNKRNITIGSKKKKEYAFLLDLFLMTAGTQGQWCREETQSIAGKLSYLKNIEPTYYRKLINKYEKKHGKIYTQVIKDILSTK